MNIHLIIAMQAEAKFIINAFALIKTDEFENVDVYKGADGLHSYHLFVNQKAHGVDRLGTVNAALLAYKSIKYFKPDFILNIGTSGGIHLNNINVFDIICAHDFIVYHDRYTGDDELSLRQSLVFSTCVNQKNHFKEGVIHGVIASSNSLIVTPRSWELIRKYKVLCVDMEAAAIAEVAAGFNISFTALKVVTDMVYEVNPTEALPQFQQNFDEAMKRLALFTKNSSSINFSF